MHYCFYFQKKNLLFRKCFNGFQWSLSQFFFQDVLTFLLIRKITKRATLWGDTNNNNNYVGFYLFCQSLAMLFFGGQVQYFFSNGPMQQEPLFERRSRKTRMLNTIQMCTETKTEIKSEDWKKNKTDDRMVHEKDWIR